MRRFFVLGLYLHFFPNLENNSPYNVFGTVLFCKREL